MLFVTMWLLFKKKEIMHHNNAVDYKRNETAVVGVGSFFQWLINLSPLKLGKYKFSLGEVWDPWNGFFNGPST